VRSPLDEARRHLPLVITNTALDADGVSIGGVNWRLRINTAWRVSEGGEEDHPAARESAALLDQRTVDAAFLGETVVGLSLQPHGAFRDIAFSFDSGRTLEVVSDFPYGEWLLSVWEASDEDAVPVFDLPGPL
jgi:hypothetical protein